MTALCFVLPKDACMEAIKKSGTSPFVTVGQLFFLMFPLVMVMLLLCMLSRDMFDISINISKRLLVNHALAEHNTPIALA